MIFQVFCIFAYVNFISALKTVNFMGCYKDLPGAKTLVVDVYKSQKQCIDLCHERYYRYSLIREEGNCNCVNYLGDHKNAENCANFCQQDCEDLKPFIADVYYTGITVSGPPRNLSVSNVTDSEAQITWEEPESFLDIESYQVKLYAVHSYANYKLLTQEYMYSNNTYHVELVSLNPATKYNVTVQGVPHNGGGAIAFSEFQTHLGEPDHTPTTPEILSRNGKTMIVRLKPVINNHGPITSYLIAVINAGSIQTVDTSNLKSFREANTEGLTYYIVAEIQPDKIGDNFTIGNEKLYGKYYNAPLEADTTYHVLLGMTSRLGDDRRVIYSVSSETTADDVIVLQMSDDMSGDSPALIIALSVAIGLISCLLIISIVGFILLRNRIQHRHRQRLNNVQELTLQGPMIDVENNGYIAEEDNHASPSHYDNLHSQVWQIPAHAVTVQQSVCLGAGQFGRVYRGSVDTTGQDGAAAAATSTGEQKPVAVYSIADRTLTPELRKQMLRGLDVSIRAARHDHVLALIGTSEQVDRLYVVFEYAPQTLKEVLLNSRTTDGNSFSSLTARRALDYAVHIARGMAHLHDRCHLVHRELCAVHVAVTDGGRTARVAGHGLARYYRTEFAPHLVRWTAVEVLRGQRCTRKSDVWSYACVLWEICSLGATPYGNMNTSEVPARVLAGHRLPQQRYVNDTLYQLLLNCWQLDSDERPTFAELADAVVALRDGYGGGGGGSGDDGDSNTPLDDASFNGHLVFNLQPNFEYEQYYPEMETSATPVL